MGGPKPTATVCDFDRGGVGVGATGHPFRADRLRNHPHPVVRLPPIQHYAPIRRGCCQSDCKDTRLRWPGVAWLAAGRWRGKGVAPCPLPVMSSSEPPH